MLLKFFLLLGAVFSATAAHARSSAQPIEIVNLGDKFQSYRAAIKAGKVPPTDIETHAKLFKDHVIGDQAQFYLDVVFDKRSPNRTFDDLLREALTESIPVFDEYSAQIDANIKTFESKTREQVSRLQKAIPDFKLDTPIYGMVSVNKFAGGVRLHRGKQVLAISFDKLAAFDRDFDMVFTHEAFHVYHHQANPTLREELGKSDHLLIAGMFIEGLATFAEGDLNPAKRKRRMVHDLSTWCASGAYKQHIKDFLADDSEVSAATYERNKDLYRKWFYTKRDGNFPFPTEAAYCIGDQVVEILAKKHTLKDLARWNVARIIGESKPILEAWRDSRSQPTVVDMGGPLDSYRVATATSKPSEKVETFLRLVADPQRVAFDDLVFRGRDPKTYLAQNLPDAETTYEGAAKLSKKLAGIIAATTERYKSRFPSADYGYTAFLMPSFDFDGRADTLSDGRIVVAFGIDRLTRYKDDDSLRIVVAHEMFHALHMQTFKSQLNKAMIGTLIWHDVWLEGLATYASGVMTGNDKIQDVLGNKNVEGCKGDLGRERGDLLAAFDKVSASIPDQADRWFGGHMFAYCLGYIAVRDLAREASLEQMLMWDLVPSTREKLRKRIEVISASTL